MPGKAAQSLIYKAGDPDETLTTISVLYEESDYPSKDYKKTRRQYWTYPKEMFAKGWKWNGKDKSNGIYSITHKIILIPFTKTRRRQRVYSYKETFIGPKSSRQEMKNNLKKRFEGLDQVYRFKISYK
jgi:hypothetical protein